MCRREQILSVPVRSVRGSIMLRKKAGRTGPIGPDTRRVAARVSYALKRSLAKLNSESNVAFLATSRVPGASPEAHSARARYQFALAVKQSGKRTSASHSDGCRIDWLARIANFFRSTLDCVPNISLIPSLSLENCASELLGLESKSGRFVENSPTQYR